MKFEDGPIRVELIPTSKGSRIGYQRDAKEEARKDEAGDHAVESALQIIYRTARQLNTALSALKEAEKPGEVEVDFGLKLDEEGRASIVHSGAAMHFRVKMKWQRPD